MKSINLSDHLWLHQPKFLCIKQNKLDEYIFYAQQLIWLIIYLKISLSMEITAFPSLQIKLANRLYFHLNRDNNAMQ